MGLIAHYMLNDNLATDVIIDDFGNHNGVVKDATGTATSTFHSVSGKINKAQDFDGTDDYIEIVDHADFNVGTGDISVFAWVNSDDDSTYQTIVVKKDYIDDFSFRLRNDNKLEIFIDQVSLVSAVAVGIDAWHFVGFTRKSGTTKLYIDGVERGSSASLTGSIDNAHNVCIGIRSTALVNPFSGLIDNVMFFDNGLSQFDVDILYNNGGGTEVITELDSQTSPRRLNPSNLPFRRRYET